MRRLQTDARSLDTKFSFLTGVYLGGGAESISGFNCNANVMPANMHKRQINAAPHWPIQIIPNKQNTTIVAANQGS